MLSDESNWTLPLGVTNFSTQYTTDTARILAYTTLALIPALVFYLFAERQLVGGLTAGIGEGMTTAAPPYRDPACPRRRSRRRPRRPDDPRREDRPAERGLGIRGRRRATAPISSGSGRWRATASARSPGWPGRRTCDPIEVARAANAIQRFLVEETRLGIPAIIHEECLHGLLALDAPCFQQSIGAARDLRPRPRRPGGRHDPSADAGDRRAPCPGPGPRHRARSALGPDRGDLRRGPVPRRGARVGLHPGAAGPRPRATACWPPASTSSATAWPKAASTRRRCTSVRASCATSSSSRSRRPCVEAGLASVMPAYCDVDGLPCHASRELLTTILRDRWGFDGIVASDYAGIEMLQTAHRLTDDPEVVAADGARGGRGPRAARGCRPTPSRSGPPSRPGGSTRRCSTRPSARILRMKFRLGLFERPYVDEPTEAELAELAEDEARVGLELARRSMVLVANDGVLPLAPSLRRIAVIGPERRQPARVPRRLQPPGPRRDADRDAPQREPGVRDHRRRRVSGRRGRAAGPPTLLDALRARLGGCEILHARGTGIHDGSDAEIAEAVEVARRCRRRDRRGRASDPG